MPVISKFYGIIIRMLRSGWRDAHFIASYGDHELVVGIWPVRIIGGEAPPRVRSMVLEWAARNQAQLLASWHRFVDGLPPQPVQPLE